MSIENNAIQNIFEKALHLTHYAMATDRWFDQENYLFMIGRQVYMELRENLPMTWIREDWQTQKISLFGIPVKVDKTGDEWQIKLYKEITKD